MYKKVLCMYATAVHNQPLRSSFMARPAVHQPILHVATITHLDVVLGDKGDAAAQAATLTAALAYVSHISHGLVR
jgi:hypothetical protein